MEDGTGKCGFDLVVGFNKIGSKYDVFFRVFRKRNCELGVNTQNGNIHGIGVIKNNQMHITTPDGPEFTLIPDHTRFCRH